MAQETQTLQAARDLTEEVLGEVETNNPVHKLASALHLVIEVMHSAPTLPKPEEIRAQLQAQQDKIVAAREQPTDQQGVIEAAPPPSVTRTLASVPPGTYEAPRNEDGTAAAPPAAASIYESRRNEDGTAAG